MKHRRPHRPLHLFLVAVVAAAALGSCSTIQSLTWGGTPSSLIDLVSVNCEGEGAVEFAFMGLPVSAECRTEEIVLDDGTEIACDMALVVVTWPGDGGTQGWIAPEDGSHEACEHAFDRDQEHD